MGHTSDDDNKQVAAIPVGNFTDHLARPFMVGAEGGVIDVVGCDEGAFGLTSAPAGILTLEKRLHARWP